MADYMNQESASDALGVSIDTLKAWKAEPWFPESGYVNGRGYDVEAIASAKVMKSDPEPAYLINRTRFTPVCPRNPEHHARVHKTDGRVRLCVCDSCGHEWKQVGEYANDMMETLSRIAKSLDEADRTELPDGKGGTVQVILIEAGAAAKMAAYCRGAIRAKA